MKENIIDEELIQLHVSASTWQEAIQKSASPLVTHKIIEERYVDSIIKSVEKAGPYFVLVPHVALAHARPDEGALENAVGITQLKEPVVFGHESNDPVKYIFTLSATGDNEHLEILGVLSNLLEQNEFFELLDHAEEPAEIVNYLNEKFKGGE